MSPAKRRSSVLVCQPRRPHRRGSTEWAGAVAADRPGARARAGHCPGAGVVRSLRRTVELPWRPSKRNTEPIPRTVIRMIARLMIWGWTSAVAMRTARRCPGMVRRRVADSARQDPELQAVHAHRDHALHGGHMPREGRIDAQLPRPLPVRLAILRSLEKAAIGREGTCCTRTLAVPARGARRARL